MEEKVKILKFEKLEVVGPTKEEAFVNAPFFIAGDATQAYNNWVKKLGDVAITENMKNDFYMDYLKKKSKCAPGTGFAIVEQSAVADTRQRPYSFEDVKNTGKRKYKTTYEIIDKVTGEVLASTQETKAKAKEITKNLYKNGLKHNVVCRYTHQVVVGEPIAFTAKYTPSKATRQGKYIVFGVKA